MTPAQITKKGGLTVTKMVSLTNTPRRTIYDLFERDQSKFIDLAIKARTELYRQELARVADEYHQDINNLEGER
tara:strand:+ start:17177 stop:17398 length:222 start_codon:yes stop_codon:yes gene_type:complete